MISNFQVFVNNFFKFFIKQGYKDSNLEMTESESVALPFGDSPKRKGGYRDSNPRPPEPQSGALTNCAISTIFLAQVVQTSLKGFEPPTHGLEGRCSIQLSYRLNLALLELSLKAFRLQESG